MLLLSCYGATITVQQFPADLVTLTEEILSGKLHFLRSVYPIPLVFLAAELDFLRCYELKKIKAKFVYVLQYFPKPRLIYPVRDCSVFRDVFRAQSDFYDEVFLQK